MSWIYLVLAGLFEVMWAVALKSLSAGVGMRGIVTVLLPLIFRLVLLHLSMRSLPLSTAYPIWTGIGSLGAFAVGVLCFGEHFTLERALGVCLVLAGVLILKVST